MADITGSSISGQSNGENDSYFDPPFTDLAKCNLVIPPKTAELDQEAMEKAKK